MVDVGTKIPTKRRAVAEAVVSMSEETRSRLFGGDLPKGDAIAAARIAGIMGVKRTSDLIPLCHPIGIDAVRVGIEEIPTGARVEVVCEVEARTGVEMEALTGASLAALTIYDMIKGVERGAAIGPVRLLAKSGGRSGEWSI